MARAFSKQIEMIVLNRCLFPNGAIHDAVISITPAQHPSTHFPAQGPTLELPKAMGGPQPLQCHCFLQCTLSVKDDQICCVAVTVCSELNGSADRSHESVCSSVTSYFGILSCRQLDGARHPESGVRMLGLVIEGVNQGPLPSSQLPMKIQLLVSFA